MLSAPCIRIGLSLLRHSWCLGNCDGMMVAAVISRRSFCFACSKSVGVQPVARGHSALRSTMAASYIDENQEAPRFQEPTRLSLTDLDTENVLDGAGYLILVHVMRISGR